jgi:hypothetical protein
VTGAKGADCADVASEAAIAGVTHYFVQSRMPITTIRTVMPIMAVKSQWSDGNEVFNLTNLCRSLLASNSPEI